MSRNDGYYFRHRATVSTAITVMQAKAGANNGFEILRCVATQYGSTTSAQEELLLIRKTIAATVTQAVIGGSGGHVFLTDPNMSNPSLSLGTAGTGVIATSEGIESDHVWRLGFNVLNGLYELAIPEERIWVPPGGIIGLKFIVAPASQTWNFLWTIRET